MRGHLVNMDRVFWFSVPAKADSNHYFRDFFLKIFYSQNGDGQIAQCVMGKTMLYHGFRYKASVSLQKCSRYSLTWTT